MAQNKDKGGNLWDALFGEIGRAVTDIREQVVEEPWFGRPVSRTQSAVERSVAEELGWVKTDRGGEHQPPAQDPGHDIDR